MIMMTEQEMRIAIAEAYGWKKCVCGDEHCGAWFPPNSNDPALGVPDYPNDLNAMHEAVKVLKEKHGHKSVGNLHRNYLLHLMNIVNPGVELWDNGAYLGDRTHAIKTAEATARQRAEAMCRTLFPERFKE